MKDYLTISEIGDLFGINVQTLYYYERIGIFKPEKRKANGYRQYRFDQIYPLATIRYLRKMGYSLDEIRQYMDLREPDETMARLYRHSEALRGKINELMRIDDAVMRKVTYIEQKRKNLDINKVEVKWFPQRWYIPIGTEDQIYLDDSFYFYPTIAFYEGTVKYFGAYVDLSSEGISEDGEENEIMKPRYSSIPAGKFLVGWHKGPYETCMEKFKSMKLTHPELQYMNKCINFNLIDQFVERDPQNYITEVQIPLASASE